MLTYEILHKEYLSLLDQQENLDHKLSIEEAIKLNERIEFLKLIIYHDWAYKRSDDINKCNRARKEFQRISELCSKYPEFKKLLDEYLVWLRENFEVTE